MKRCELKYLRCDEILKLDEDDKEGFADRMNINIQEKIMDIKICKNKIYILKIGSF